MEGKPPVQPRQLTLKCGPKRPTYGGAQALAATPSGLQGAPTRPAREGDWLLPVRWRSVPFNRLGWRMFAEDASIGGNTPSLYISRKSRPIEGAFQWPFHCWLWKQTKHNKLNYEGLASCDDTWVKSRIPGFVTPAFGDFVCHCALIVH